MDRHSAPRLLRALLAVSVVLQALSFFPAMPRTGPAAASAAPEPALTATAEPTATPTVEPSVTPEAAPFTSPLVTPVLTTTPGLTATAQVFSLNGGTLLSADGRIRLEVPPGLFKNATQLSIRPQAIKSLTETNGALMQFDLDAQDLSTSVPVHQFDQPLTLTVNIKGLLDPAQIPAGYHVYLAYQTAEGQRVEITPITVNYELGTISAQITHFSSWDAGVAPGTPGVWAFAYNAPQASLFSGAATYAIPLDLPAGRNGLQPKLSLTYNSARLNGRTGANTVERGPIGDSWSIETMSIVRNRWLGCEWNSTGIEGDRTSGACFQDLFTLLINGTGYDLDPVPVWTWTNPETLNVRYYAQDAPGIYIERHNGCLQYNHDSGACTSLNPAGGDSLLNTSGEYWLVRLPDGTQARLGYTADAEQVVTDICNPYGMRYCHHPGGNDQIQLGYRGKVNPAPPDGATTARSWRVDTMTDTLGNTMTFDYAKYPTTGAARRVTLRDIYYNGGLTHIALPGNDSPTDGEPTIDRIDIYTANAAGAQTLVRRYRLTRTTDTKHYDHCNGGGPVDTSYTTLASVQEQDGISVTLPAQTFTYVWQPTAPECKDLKQLSVVNNGYGGSTTMTYASIGPWNNYAVQSIRSTDGLPGTAALYSTYTYGNACYDYYGSPCSSRATTVCGPDCGNHTWRNYLLSGFDVVTVMQWDGSAALAATTHYFYNTNPDWRLGREWRTQQFDGNNQPLTQSDNVFTTIANGPTTFTYLSDASQSVYSGYALSITKRITYTYDTYANLTETVEYDTSAQPYRRTYWSFYPNTTAWIVNKPGYQNVDSWTAGQWSLVSGTWYSYDGHPAFSTPPGALGQLTAVRAWNGVRPAQLIDTVYTYDSWGNRITEKTYDNVGTGSAYANLNPKTITTTYDSQYHLYPIKVTNPLGQNTQTAYDYILGVPTIITDANGLTTTMTYDGFGRLFDVYKPGDAANDPSQRYRYSDVGSPFWIAPLRIVEQRKPVSGGPGVRHLYDGLGREIQTQGPVSVTVSGGALPVDVLVTRRYDARGLVISETVPYTVPAYVYNSNVNPYTTTNAASAPKTLAAYDALGRTTVITAPDGTQIAHVYELVNDNGQTVQTDNLFDANRHRRQYRYDAFGRLSRALELTGDCSGSGWQGYTCGGAYTTQWSVYAVTTYTYDILNNLTQVRDALGNTTVITYNALSRKTGMIDPDMGAWSYQYDLAGNLITQTDALNQALWFKYDALNRLVEKRKTNSSGPWLASYTYDTGTNGKGHRTAMSDTSGSATWKYDQRGRVLTETKAITGAGTYVTGYGYDALDRVITTTYPTGEVITQTYNAQGLLENVKSASPQAPYSNQWYAKNLDYNANGSLALLQLGNNNVNTTYTYFPLNFRLQRIQVGNLLDLNYGYDKVGNVTRLTDTLNSNQTQTFGYDALDRLRTAATTAVGNGQYTESYNYDAIGNLTYKDNLYDYWYEAGAQNCASGTPALKPHAVSDTGVFGIGYITGHFDYDCNGNMTGRAEMMPSGQLVNYTQAWDVENRLTAVTNTTTLSVTKFIYDGDGNRVKKIAPNGQTTIYIGAILEKNVSTGVTTTYYFAGSTRITMRVYTAPNSSVVYFLAGDHLGSTSLTLNASGSKIGEMKYYPYGETRYTWGSTPTDRRFTGQRQEDSAALGSLYDYGARAYSPLVGRFLSADTIVPKVENPQTLNRFSYVLNNPVRLTDPTGHKCLEDDDCGSAGKMRIRAREEYGIAFTGVWSYDEMAAVVDAASRIDQGFRGAVAEDLSRVAPTLQWNSRQFNMFDNPAVGEVFRAVYGPLTFNHDPHDGTDPNGNPYWAETHIPVITVYDNAFRDGYTGLNGVRNVAHELGHGFAQRAGERPYNDLTQTWNNAPNFPRRGDRENGFADRYPGWQQSTSATNREEFADMFLGWSYNHWQDSDAGRTRSQWMTTNMADWMLHAINQ